MNLLEGLLCNALSGGSGQSGPSGAVLYTRQTLTADQQAQARENIGSPAAVRVVPVAGQEATVSPEQNCVYQCGELQTLTIPSSPAQCSYTVVFTSGAAATTSSVPEAILGLEGFAAEANTMYEINVLDNRAVIASWPVPAGNGDADE